LQGRARLPAQRQQQHQLPMGIFTPRVKLDQAGGIVVPAAYSWRDV
jgi:hypothetical protein